jgi:hypothetical protein
MNLFTVTHSVLSQHALVSEVLPFYFGESLVECRLLVRGMNDSYFIRIGGEQYILRAYRHGHRTLPDIRHELDLLLFLHDYDAGTSENHN